MSNKVKILNLLRDGEWHNAYQLNDLFGWKWASRVSDLIKDGYLIEKRRYQKDKPELEYRLLTKEYVSPYQGKEIVTF